MNDDRYLMHHGVKGMKWGVRKDKPSASSVAKNLVKYGSPVTYGAAKLAKKRLDTRGERKQARIERKRAKALDRATSARYTYKQRKHLSDDELRSRINRLNMEKQLKDLSKGRSSGPEFIMLDNGQRAARQALGKYGAKVALNAVGLGGAADFIRPKK